MERPRIYRVVDMVAGMVRRYTTKSPLDAPPSLDHQIVDCPIQGYDKGVTLYQFSGLREARAFLAGAHATAPEGSYLINLEINEGINPQEQAGIYVFIIDLDTTEASIELIDYTEKKKV